MEIFNNRELASVTLIVAVLIWSSGKNKDVGTSILGVFRALQQKPIIITLGALTLYTSLVVFVLFEVGVWNAGQLKNTVLWLVFVGAVQVFGATKIQEPRHYLRTSLQAQIKLVVMVQFLVAFHSYGYFSELIIVAMMSVAAMCSVIAGNNPEPNHQRVKKLFDAILVVIGTSLLLGSLYSIYTEPGKFFSVGTFRDFLVPMLLSVGVLPFIYAFYLVLVFEKAFVKIRIYTDCKTLQRYAKIKSFVVFRGNHDLIYLWLDNACKPEFVSKDSIRESIMQFKQNLVKKNGITICLRVIRNAWHFYYALV
ncbi:hypothetical protein [Vibrio harveyi]|uniref:hypothetical protein n=1 Tax=Vibrio harveyi TaxID=669 RepID=UPI0018FE3B63|nr:hypothetical protein [Vibrio harveyi]